GYYHTCGLTTDSVAYCWGNDITGQLGDGGGALDTQSPSAVDTSVIPGSKTFAQLTAGYYHTCGLTTDSVAYCWGSDGIRELGNGGTSLSKQSPSAVDTSVIPGSKVFVQLIAGGAHTCGVTADGVPHCWGYDYDGELGNGGAALDMQSPSAVDTSAIPGDKAFVQLTGGFYDSCGLTVDGVAYCWGSDSFGQLGNGGTSLSTQSPSAVDIAVVSGSKVFDRLTAGWSHNCGLTTDGATYCWGYDDGGQLGNGGAALSTQSPSAVDLSVIPGNRVFVELSGGASHTCGLTADGVAHCWGSDSNGKLGNGGAALDTQSPSAVDTSAL
ncbi:MAG: hypothetical protein AAB426_08300, partial [Myxococcota bacterium]